MRACRLTPVRTPRSTSASSGCASSLGFWPPFHCPLSLLPCTSIFNSTRLLRETGKLHLASLAESQRNTVDLFLQERVTNIFSLFHGTEFTLDPSQQQMDRYLQGLRQTSDAFIDVGFCNSEGVQIGYAGPFPDLYGKDYSSEDWFVSVMERDTNYHVSDIYLGFRKKPHFTIAVKQLIDTKPYVMRATLDPDKFYIFLRNISRGKGVDSVLVNKGGYYQVVAPDRGALLGKSEYMPSGSEGSGVEEISANGDSILVAYVWLKETPWVLMVRQPLDIAYAQIYRSRTIMIASTAAIMAVMGFFVWMMTDRLLKGAQATAESHEKLQSELIHASKMASVGELAAGIAHEINNPLAAVVATTGVIRDLFDPEFNLAVDAGDDQRGACQHRHSGVSGARNHSDAAEVLAKEPSAAGPRQSQRHTRRGGGRAQGAGVSGIQHQAGPRLRAGPAGNPN